MLRVSEITSSFSELTLLNPRELTAHALEVSAPTGCLAPLAAPPPRSSEPKARWPSWAGTAPPPGGPPGVPSRRGTATRPPPRRVRHRVSLRVERPTTLRHRSIARH